MGQVFFYIGSVKKRKSPSDWIQRILNNTNSEDCGCTKHFTAELCTLN